MAKSPSWNNPAILAQLDRYEGSRYSRVLRRVLMRDGQERDAWVYVYRAPLLHARSLPGGRWPVE